MEDMKQHVPNYYIQVFRVWKEIFNSYKLGFKIGYEKCSCFIFSSATLLMGPYYFKYFFCEDGF